MRSLLLFILLIIGTGISASYQTFECQDINSMTAIISGGNSIIVNMESHPQLELKINGIATNRFVTLKTSDHNKWKIVLLDRMTFLDKNISLIDVIEGGECILEYNTDNSLLLSSSTSTSPGGGGKQGMVGIFITVSIFLLIVIGVLWKVIPTSARINAL